MARNNAHLALVERALPLDLPKPAARPTGKVMDTSKPYTLPLNNELTITRCIGPYTEIDRKLWATLAAIAWDDLDKKSIHESNVRDIARLFREIKGADNGSAWVIASAQRLINSRLDWNDEKEVGTVALISGLKIVKSTGAIYYQFPDFLIDRLLDNKQFSRLRLHFMIGLSGKYSVSLYMLFESAANMRHPVIEMTIEELRDVLSVPKGKLEKWFDLNRKAILPAIQQINDNTTAAGFSVTCEPLGTGRKFERVRFTVKKSAARVTDEKTITQRPKPIPTTASATLKRYAIDDALGAIRKNAPGLDAHNVLAEFERWQAGCETPAQNPMGALIAFARKKHGELKHQL